MNSHQNTGTPKPEKKWLTAIEAAQYINKAVKTLYNLRCRGLLKGERSGGTGSLQFTTKELDDYVTAKSFNFKTKNRERTKELL